METFWTAKTLTCVVMTPLMEQALLCQEVNRIVWRGKKAAAEAAARLFVIRAAILGSFRYWLTPSRKRAITLLRAAAGKEIGAAKKGCELNRQSWCKNVDFWQFFWHFMVMIFDIECSYGKMLWKSYDYCRSEEFNKRKGGKRKEAAAMLCVVKSMVAAAIEFQPNTNNA